MPVRDLDDYELIQRWRATVTEAAFCWNPVPKRFITAYLEALEAEMARRCPPAETQP